ncbi:hypothetical protein [Pseudonocardia acaciae]|uniref:hypothetical protein n=1 Tax=Pseudonocardia acaciae TaxID=551276 RepID=UPI00056BC610|nr:hypothetical protein [Pseudonocardia acaciae]
MPERLVWRAGDAEATTAQLLDDVRRLIVEARERGEDPGELVVDEATRRVLDLTKRREVQRGQPVLVLGLRVVSEERSR